MRVVLFVSLVIAAPAVFAQNVDPQNVDPQNVDPQNVDPQNVDPQNVDQRLQAAGQALTEAEAQGAANAVRPGDEALSCEALQAEMVAIAQSPEMQGLVGFGQQAQADLAAAQEAPAAQEAGRSRPRMFRQMVQGAASGVVPGLGRGAAAAQQAAAAAQAAQTAAQTQANLERVAAIGEQAALMAGPALRGQRVMELAQARNCAWIQEGGMPPGAVPPGAVPPGFPAGAVPPGIPGAPAETAAPR